MAKNVIDEAIELDEIDPYDYKLCCALMGPSGSGKSTAAASTLPGRVLVIEYDGRWQSLVGIPGIKIIKLHSKDFSSPETWMRAVRLRKELWIMAQHGKLPYDSIIEDGLTMMGRYAMSYALTLDTKRGLGDTPAKQHWQPQMKELGEHILTMKTLPVHYVLCGHLELFGGGEDDDEGAIWLPKITGKLRTEIAGWFNECYYTYRKGAPGGGLNYYWTTGGSGKMDFFKSSLNQFGKYWKDPIPIDLSKKPAGFQFLLEKRFGKGAFKEKKEEEQDANS